MRKKRNKQSYIRKKGHCVFNFCDNKRSNSCDMIVLNTERARANANKCPCTPKKEQKRKRLTDRRQTSMKELLIPVNIENEPAIYQSNCLSVQNVGPAARYHLVVQTIYLISAHVLLW